LPTNERADSFKSDYKHLSDDQRAKFKVATRTFVANLLEIEAGKKVDFDPHLRVKPMKYYAGIWEMTWNGDGRATFEYGVPLKRMDEDGNEVADDPPKRHVVWRRIGTHAIFRRP